MVMHESYEENATLWEHYTQSKFVPFNPTDKYTIATIVPKDGSPPFRLMKGAPQVSSPPLSWQGERSETTNRQRSETSSACQSLSSW